MTLKNRNEFAKLLTEKKLFGRAAEIGVAEGYFSHELLRNWPGVVCQIDPYQILNEEGFSGHGCATQDELDARYERMVRKAMEFKGRCRVIRAISENAASAFNDLHFDFVYIDANHTYESVKKDIELWYPKVKRGGILAGHDYLDGEFGGQQYGVKRAVGNFAASEGYNVHTTLETDWPSWFIFV